MSRPKVSVFMAMSLDGFIADKNGGLEWLESVSVRGEDYGYAGFFGSIDSVIVGRTTYEKVRTFPEWPYAGKRVFILTHRKLDPLKNEKPVSGELKRILESSELSDSRRIYLDGGQAVRQGLEERVVDDMTISIVPALLGGGTRPFGDLPSGIKLINEETRSYSSGLVRIRYHIDYGR